MAAVYLVQHEDLGTRHALKVLSIRKRSLVRRLLQEGTVQAELRHPNIVAVDEVIEDEQRPSLLLELVEGPTLETLLAVHRFDVSEAIQLFQGIVAGVEHAHNSGLVHRDLKPGNVLLALDHDGMTPKVADFGLAKVVDGGMGHTRTGDTMGTPMYMAPEQVRDSSRVDHRADIYSLGCLLYEMVIGQPPFNGSDVIEIFSAIGDGRYTDPEEALPGIPAELADAIRAMLATDPEERPASCAELRTLLGTDNAATWLANPDALPPDAAATQAGWLLMQSPALPDGVLPEPSTGPLVTTAAFDKVEPPPPPRPPKRGPATGLLRSFVFVAFALSVVGCAGFLGTAALVELGLVRVPAPFAQAEDAVEAEEPDKPTQGTSEDQLFGVSP